MSSTKIVDLRKPPFKATDQDTFYLDAHVAHAAASRITSLVPGTRPGKYYGTIAAKSLSVEEFGVYFDVTAAVPLPAPEPPAEISEALIDFLFSGPPELAFLYETVPGVFPFEDEFPGVGDAPLSEVFLAGPRRIAPGGLVPWDPLAPTASRRHQQIVAQILNSLIMQEMLVRASGTTIWDLGYVPGDQQDWAGNPTTIGEALDRIAALLKTLNGGTPP